jgi:hypothetical protein
MFVHLYARGYGAQMFVKKADIARQHACSLAALLMAGYTEP